MNNELFFHIMQLKAIKIFFAVYARDGYDYDGYKLRVEFPRGGGGSFRGSRSAGASSGSSKGRGPPARRSQYRVMVTGM